MDDSTVRLLFAGQLLWFLTAWSAVGRLVVWPWSAHLADDDRVALWVAPQMLRVLGVGLLVPALSPGMPSSFAVATALGDSATAVLALAAFVALKRGSGPGRTLAWACMVVGVADVTVALAHAAQVDAYRHLAAQWYVPVLGLPALLVAHVGGIAALLRTRRNPT